MASFFKTVDRDIYVLFVTVCSAWVLGAAIRLSAEFAGLRALSDVGLLNKFFAVRWRTIILLTGESAKRTHCWRRLNNVGSTQP